MITVRTISRVLVISAVAFIYNVNAQNTTDVVVQIIKDNTIAGLAVAVATALPEDADVAKSAVETGGILFNQCLVSKVDPASLAANFAANFTARKAGRCLAKNGYTLPNPQVGVAANHVVAPVDAAMRAAAPQIVAGLIVMGARNAGLL